MGERAVLLEFGSSEEVHRMWSALEAERPAGIEDVVAGARTLLIVASEAAGDPLTVVSRLPDPSVAGTPRRPRTVTIPVAYDGPDLAGVADLAGVSPAELAGLHSAATYTVGFLGFSPGFAYLFGGDPRLAVPRLESPRPSVPAGSVAVAAGMTAVYPQSTPGGWRIIGRTDVAMFDPFRAVPAKLAPGDRVRFRPVGDVMPLRAPEAPTAGRGAPAAGLEVVDPGPLLTVQDLGRRGWAHAGVPPAGAADRGSAALANRLVGNPPGAAVLESTFGGCRLRLRADRVLAVTGAAAELTVDGLPARRHAGLPLPAGSEVSVGRAADGTRVYIAVAGGLDVEQVLGSRSTDTLSGLGPPPLRPGDRLALGPLPAAAGATGAGRAGGTGAGRAGGALAGRVGGAGAGRAGGALAGSGVTRLPGRSRSVEVRARLGPRSDWLSTAGLEVLAGSGFVVGGSSDRTGIRLDGPPVGLSRAGSLPSEGMVAGAVQLPPDGRPIVLLRNHPTTGGYPVVAVVEDEGVDALAQVAPGDTVRFRLIG